MGKLPFEFDLQLFAEDGEKEAGAEGQTGGDASPGAVKTDNAPAAPGTLSGAKDTILGAHRERTAYRSATSWKGRCLMEWPMTPKPRRHIPP